MPLMPEWSLLTNLSSLSFQSSKVTNGYQKLPSGLIIQWGTFYSTSTSGNVTFPIAYPTDPLIVMAGDSVSTTYVQAIGVDLATMTKTQFTWYSGSNPQTMMFISIGH